MSIIRVLLLCLILGATSACQRATAPIEDLKSVNYKMFFGVTVEARKVEDNQYVAYKFIKELGNKNYVLPNYKYYNKRQIAAPDLFDIAKIWNSNRVK